MTTGAHQLPEPLVLGLGIQLEYTRCDDEGIDAQLVLMPTQSNDHADIVLARFKVSEPPMKGYITIRALARDALFELVSKASMFPVVIAPHRDDRPLDTSGEIELELPARPKRTDWKLTADEIVREQNKRVEEIREEIQTKIREQRKESKETRGWLRSMLQKGKGRR